MYEYKAYGMNIHSEIFLPELIPETIRKPDLKIRNGNFDLFSGSSIKKDKTFESRKILFIDSGMI